MYVICFQYADWDFNLGMYHNAVAAVEMISHLVDVHTGDHNPRKCKLILRGVQGETLLKYNVI